MKHTNTELLQMQSLPLDIKVKMTQRRIREWYDKWEGDVYISFSGGKDSTCVKHIADSMGLKIPSVYVNTGLDYPEVKDFVMRVKHCETPMYGAVEVIKPFMRFDEVIEKYGYPVISKDVAYTVEHARMGGKGSYCYKKLFGELYRNGVRSKFCHTAHKGLYNAPFKISDKCCLVMKKKPAKQYERRTKRKPILGTMAEESDNRRSAWFKNGCNAFNARHPVSTPIAFWKDEDVLEYLYKNNVPYASVYGDIVQDENGWHTTGLERTGCVFCMFGVHMEKEPNRFQKMKETHPAHYRYCMDKLGCGEVLDWLKIPR